MIDDRSAKLVSLSEAGGGFPAVIEKVAKLMASATDARQLLSGKKALTSQPEIGIELLKGEEKSLVCILASEEKKSAGMKV